MFQIGKIINYKRDLCKVDNVFNSNNKQFYLKELNDVNFQLMYENNIVFEQIINQLLIKTSKDLKDYLFINYNLISYLKKIGDYFLCFNGHFMTEFIKENNEELRKPIYQLSLYNINIKLQCCIRECLKDVFLHSNLGMDEIEVFFFQCKLQEYIFI